MEDIISPAVEVVSKAGRKFQDGDVTPPLRQAVEEYVKSYDGRFSFILEMRATCKRYKGLTVAQARGVLNCILSEHSRANAPREQLAFEPIAAMFVTAKSKMKWPKIRLRAVGGIDVAISVAGAQARFPGSINVTGAERDQNTGRFPFWGRIHKDGSFEAFGTPPTVLELLREFAANPEGVASAHGKMTGQCCFCNRALTDERSTEVGYGPVCAESYGLAWGKKAVAA